jgi:hypothetical protein
MTLYDELDPEAREWLEGLHAQLQATAREYESDRLAAGLPEPAGPPAIPPGAVVTARFVDVVDDGQGLGVNVEEHSLIWPDAG